MAAPEGGGRRLSPEEFLDVLGQNCPSNDESRLDRPSIRVTPEVDEALDGTTAAAGVSRDDVITNLLGLLPGLLGGELSLVDNSPAETDPADTLRTASTWPNDGPALPPGSLSA